MTDTLPRSAATDHSVSTILDAAEVVLRRLGHDKLSLAQIAQVSLIPLARIYQFFADRYAVLGALSSRELERVGALIDTRSSWSAYPNSSDRVDRVIERLAESLGDETAAYLVLCGPFDAVSSAARLDAVNRLGLALRHALGDSPTGDSDHRSADRFGYAAELVFACFRRSHEVDARITADAVALAQRAVQSFVGAQAQ